MYYLCHKVSFIHWGSNIISPDCIKKKKTSINRKNADDKCFQYTATVALTYEEIKPHPEKFQILNHLI